MLAALRAACLAGYVFVYAAGRAGTPIRSDGFCYYVYLPAWFLYHDASLAAVADDCCGGEFPGVHGDRPLAGHRPLGERASDRRRRACWRRSSSPRTR